MNNSIKGSASFLEHKKQAVWLELIRDGRWSHRQKIKLIQKYGTAERVLALRGTAFEASHPKAGVSSTRRKSDLVESDLAWLRGANNHLITFDDERYPSLLRQIHDPPIALFAIGELSVLEAPMIALVGSRNPTPVGARVASQMAGDLATAGITVVSGMALGIDAAAHQGALKVPNSTVAVLGSGADTIYPSRNHKLYSDICKSGCILSEYPLGTPPSRYNFPYRNRIVSGLCLATVIVEAADKSGTLITARIASEQDREVAVVPGSALSQQYSGSHRLIRQGATIVTSAQDVLRELSLPLQAFLADERADAEPTDSSSTLSNELQLVKSCLSAESTNLNDLIRASRLTSTEVSSILLELELHGSVAIAQDGGYVLLE